jgi:hypothetical protein
MNLNLKFILNRSTRQNNRSLRQNIESWIKTTSQNSNKILKKRINSNIHTNKLLVINISVTSFYGKFTTLLRVIHEITNSVQI